MIRVSTGISGLNEMIEGGIPAGHTIAAIGPPGAGKTTLCLQYVWDGLMKDELCMYISLEEEEEKLLKTALNYGWDFQKYIDRGTLSLIKLDALDINGTMERMLSELPKLISNSGVRRIVIDPFILVEMAFDNDHKRRVNIYELVRTIGRTGVTTIITSEALNGYHSHFGIIEYIVDGVFVLEVIHSKQRGSLIYAIQVNKLRWSSHSKDMKPYAVTSNGIDVYLDSNVYWSEND
jgi:circadian clock protein KaiC